MSNATFWLITAGWALLWVLLWVLLVLLDRKAKRVEGRDDA